jgi:hypothetical protein
VIDVRHHLVRRDAVRGEYRVLVIIAVVAARIREPEELRVFGQRILRADDLAAEADRDIQAGVGLLRAAVAALLDLDLDLDLYLRMLRRECQRDPCRRRGGRSRTGAACRPVARLEIPRPGFSRAAAWPIAARMPGVCSVLDAQKTLSDELCGRTRTAFTAPSAIFSPYCLSMVRRCPHGDRIVR